MPTRRYSRNIFDFFVSCQETISVEKLFYVENNVICSAVFMYPNYMSDCTTTYVLGMPLKVSPFTSIAACPKNGSPCLNGSSNQWTLHRLLRFVINNRHIFHYNVVGFLPLLLIQSKLITSYSCPYSTMFGRHIMSYFYSSLFHSLFSLTYPLSHSFGATTSYHFQWPLLEL